MNKYLVAAPGAETQTCTNRFINRYDIFKIARSTKQTTNDVARQCVSNTCDAYCGQYCLDAYARPRI